MKHGHLQMGDDSFPVHIQGDGRQLMFVHGAPGDWRTFAPHASALSDRYRCITYTQRWFGTADWSADGPPFGTAAHAADLVNIAASLAMAPMALVAWSYGAHVAMAAALERPDLFDRLLVYEPGFSTYIHVPETYAAWKVDSDAAWAPVLAAADDADAMLRAMIDGFGGDGAFDALADEDREVLRDSRAMLPRWIDQPPPIGLSCASLAGLTVPTAVAFGLSSRPCYIIPSVSAAQCIGGSRFDIDGVDHLWPVTDKEGFTSLVAHWMDDPSFGRHD